MVVYYLGVLAITIFWLGVKKKEGESYSKKSRKKFCVFSWIVLSLIEGLRDFSVGTDTIQYAATFEMEQMDYYEIGFQLIGKFVHLFSDNPIVFLLIVSLITNGLIFRAIYKNSSNVAVSAFTYMSLYYYFNSFNAVRQYLAIGLILCAYTFLKDDKFMKYFIFVLIAALIHTTAIVGLLLFPLYQLNLKREIDKRNFVRWFGILLVFEILFVYLFKNYFHSILEFFPRYMDAYGESDYYFEGRMSLQSIVTNALIFVVYLCFCENINFAMFLAISVFLSFGTIFSFLFHRIIWYFDVFSIFALADIWQTKTLNYKSRTILRVAIFIACLSFMTYYLLMNVMKVGDYSFANFL